MHSAPGCGVFEQCKSVPGEPHPVQGMWRHPDSHRCPTPAQPHPHTPGTAARHCRPAPCPVQQKRVYGRQNTQDTAAGALQPVLHCLHMRTSRNSSRGAASLRNRLVCRRAPAARPQPVACDVASEKGKESGLVSQGNTRAQRRQRQPRRAHARAQLDAALACLRNITSQWARQFSGHRVSASYACFGIKFQQVLCAVALGVPAKVPEGCAARYAAKTSAPSQMQAPTPRRAAVRARGCITTAL